MYLKRREYLFGTRLTPGCAISTCNTTVFRRRNKNHITKIKKTYTIWDGAVFNKNAAPSIGCVYRLFHLLQRKRE